MSFAAEGGEKLLLVLGLLPAVGFIVVGSVLKMVDGEFGVGAGLLAIFGSFALLAVAAFANNQGVTIVVFVVLATLGVTYPFARDQLSRIEHAKVDLHRLERAYEALCARPDNAAARFGLASALADHGLLGHAAVLSEQTFASLSDDIDPTTNQSMRGIFMNEQHEARKWRRAAKPEDFRAVKCPKCGTFNEPGHVFCKSCATLHLLELARGGVSKAKVGQKLVVAWALLGLLVGGIAFVSEWLGGAARLVAVGAGVAVVGIVLAALFRPVRLRA